jgi:hypothetical protein
MTPSRPPRPSWGYCPDDLRWSDLDLEDRFRVVLVVVGVVAILLAGSAGGPA